MADEVSAAPSGDTAGTVLGTPAPEGTASGAFDWAATLGDQYETFKPTIESKGWKGPADVVRAYDGAQKLLGDRQQPTGLKLPGDDAKPDEWGQFWDAIGRPKDASEYNLPVPEGQDDAFAKTASGWFHEAGLAPKQAGALAEKWNAWVEAQNNEADAEFQRKAADDLGKLKLEWKTEYDGKVEFAKRALRAAGMSEEEGAALERTLGVGKAVKLMAMLGSHLREDTAVGDRTGSRNMSAQEADTKFKANQADETFRKRLLDRYAPGHAEAVQEQERLTKIRLGQ